jgi:hypothetical protein
MCIETRGLAQIHHVPTVILFFLPVCGQPVIIAVVAQSFSGLPQRLFSAY